MLIKETPNKITAVLKVTATAEFFDDEASEETVRYVIEQDLVDAGFDVDVAMLKEQPEIVRCKDCKHWGTADCSMWNNWGYEEPTPGDCFCAIGERR